MVLDQTANFVRGTVSASIASGDTTISVTDASIFPDPTAGNYNLVLWDTNQGRPDQDPAVEVVRVTGRDTGADTLTVTRAQEGTSASAHPATSALLLDATSKQFDDIEAGEHRADRIYDSTGRYLGTLTGTNDAQTVIDAIADRVSGAAVIVPDPGFDLDWEQQVDIPGADDGFEIHTRGVPRLSIPSGFSGSYAINKPDGDAGGFTQDYHIGSFFIDDDTNGVLSRGMRLSNIGSSVVEPSWFFNCPGILVVPGSAASANNRIIAPKGNKRGPVVELDTATGNNVGANTVIEPFFNEVSTPTSETAFIDRSNWNRWLHTSVEEADRILLADDAQGYYISESDWDDPPNYSVTVHERGPGVAGEIHLSALEGNATKARIVSSSTQLFGPHASSQVFNPYRDYFDMLGRSTPAMSLANVGLRDNSPNGSVSGINGVTSQEFTIASGASSGNQGIVDQGGIFKTAQDVAPKLMIACTPDTTGGSTDDDDDVVVRVGIRRNADNRCEMLYDPGNNVGATDHSSGNWFFELETGGTLHNSLDTGEFSTAINSLALGRLSTDSTADWYAWAEGTEVGTISNASTTMNRCQFYAEVQTQTSAEKSWTFLKGRTPRLWMT